MAFLGGFVAFLIFLVAFSKGLQGAYRQQKALEERKELEERMQKAWDKGGKEKKEKVNENE